MAMNSQGRNLGTATGSIQVDVSSLKTASTAINDFVASTKASFASINAGMNNLAAMSKNMAGVLAAQSKQAAVEAKAAADVQIAAINAQAKAQSDATKLEIQNLKLLQQERNQANRSGGGGGFGAGAGNMRIPTFLQFAAYPVAQAFTGLGMAGVGSGVMTAGAFAGLGDVFTTLPGQVRELGTRLREMGGVFGGLANLGGTLAAPLGATAAGFASLLAVIAPLAILVGGFALIMNTLSASFAEAKKNAEDYVTRQQELNQLIAEGGTSEDINQLIGDARATRDSSQFTIEQLQPIRDLFDRLSPLQMQAIQGAAAGFGGSQLALAGARAVPGNYISELDRKVSEMTGGAIASVEAFWSQWDRLMKEFRDGSTAVAQYADKAGDARVQANNLAAANNASAEAALEEAEFRRSASRASSEQIQQMIADRNAEADAIALQGALMSGELYEAQVARVAQLEREVGILEELQAAADARALDEFTEKLVDMAAAAQIANRRLLQDRSIAQGDRQLDRAITAARELEDFERGRALKAADFAKSQARAEQDYLDERAQAAREFQEAQEDAETEHRDRMQKIMSDARISILEAAARLDARAVFETQRRRNEALNEQNQNAQEERDQRAEQYQEQLDDAEAQYQKQRDRALEDYNEQIAREDAQRAIRANREQQDFALQQYRQERTYQIQDQRRAEDQARQINQLYQHYNNVALVIANGMHQVEMIFGSSMVTMILLAQQFQDAVAAGVPVAQGGGSSGGFGITGFASGTPYVPFDMLALIHQGERIIPAAQNRAGAYGGGGMTVNVGDIVLGDIGAYSPSEIQDLIHDGLESGLRSFFLQGAGR